ncbi:hypothetical protein BC941DRAFT_451645 [Chlamydoabsidia padenii]|nr:hypothetical protein BC941DRAFT_451645 [Chlamydoabsidia padenii]
MPSSVLPELSATGTDALSIQKDQVVEEAVQQEEKPVVIEELLPPEEDEEIIEDTAVDIADAGAAFDVDPDKMFDVDISEGEEANEEEKLIFKKNNQDALMPSSNSGGQNQVTRSRYEDSDHDIDLDIRGRTSSLGGANPIMDSQSGNSFNNNDSQQLGDVAAPGDLFSANDQNDIKTEDQQQQSNKDTDETTEDDTNPLGEEDDSAFLDNTTDADLDTGADDDQLDNGPETDEDEIDDTGAELDEDEATEADVEDSLNPLGEDLDDSIADFSTSGQEIGKAQQDFDGGDNEDDGQQEDLQDEDNEGDKNDDKDDTVEQTWDMDGDDVDDDQANSSVDAALDAGDEEEIDNKSNIDTMVDDESVGTQNDNVISENDEYNDKSQDGELTWNNDDDDNYIDTEAENEEQEETMEQGTVEENDNDRLGSTLEQALDALEDDQGQVSTSPNTAGTDKELTGNLSSLPSITDEKNDLPYDSNEKYELPPQQQQQQQEHGTVSSSTIGQSTAEDLATVDTSFLLLLAVLILICFRLPYVKRFFVKLFKKQDTSSTLPYHTTHNKELD